MKKLSFKVVTALSLLLAACAKESEELPIPDKGTGMGDKPVEVPVGDGNVLKVRTVIKVGKVIYDSIPSVLKVVSWDSAQVPYEQVFELAPGENQIALRPAAVKHQLKFSKWGVQTDTTINASDVAKIKLQRLGGAKPAKFLTKEEKYLLRENSWRPDSRAEYFYATEGVLSSVSYYQKTTKSPDLVLTTEDVFVYRDNYLARIKRYGENGALHTSRILTYNTAGQVTGVADNTEDGTSITGSVEYIPAASQVKFFYKFFNGNTMAYTQQYKGGNVQEEAASSSRGTGESAKYSYDFYINPFVHLNYPDMYLSRRSKNNRAAEERQFNGNIPTNVPYKYEYTYDADGYPKELLTSFKGFISGEHLFTIKTVYTY
jgi:hypothetical protein